jgi:hypothetical protein
VFENRVLKRIFGPKRDEVTRGWRKLHNEELSPSIIRMIRSRRESVTGYVARMQAKRKAIKVFMGQPGGKRPLARPTRRRKDYIKTGLRETGRGGMNCINLAQDRDQ